MQISFVVGTSLTVDSIDIGNTFFTRAHSMLALRAVQRVRALLPATEAGCLSSMDGIVPFGVPTS